MALRKECPLDSTREVEGPELRRSYLLPDGPRPRVKQIGHSLRSGGITGRRLAIERSLLRSDEAGATPALPGPILSRASRCLGARAPRSIRVSLCRFIADPI